MSPDPPRQTLGYLRSLFEARGLRPKSKLGQCFLVDLNLLEVLARSAELTRADLVLEVGAGSGSLTARLAEQAGAVLAVELDAGFFALARETTAAYPHVAVLHADILRNKNTLEPRVVDALRPMLAGPGIQRLKLVANLPYVVATPVIINLLLLDLPLERLVVTIQWELAERITASPSTAAYGALAVQVQAVADASILRRLPPAAFWPRPMVDSAIVLIQPRVEKRARIADLAGFQAFVRHLYLHRRKNLRGGLAAFLPPPWSKDHIDRQLARLGLDPAGRAESLPVDEHLRLWRALLDPPQA